MGNLESEIQRAVIAIESADAILIGAGAGMGVDSGLPDFRGNDGFWRAYPPFKKLGLSFYDLANPYWFRQNPPQAWGFYGHRLNLYRATAPHDGFRMLVDCVLTKPGGYFVFTSNVDGHFQRAGFDPQQIVECHGAIEYLQCRDSCTGEIWKSDSNVINIDETKMLASDPLPSCPKCGSLARPNILMFGDSGWLPDRTDEQYQRYTNWLQETADCKLVVIEIGAGTAVPTVRFESERRVARQEATLIRINPREPEGCPDTISISAGALTSLRKIFHEE